MGEGIAVKLSRFVPIQLGVRLALKSAWIMVLFCPKMKMPG